MTGARINITLDDAAISAAFTRVAAALRGPALKAVAEGLLETTKQRFDRGVSPTGAAWAALNPAYAQIKRGNRILVAAGTLRNSVTREVVGNRITIGTKMPYAAVHQFGATIRPKNAKALVFRLGRTGPRGGRSSGFVRAKSVTIPARPYLGPTSTLYPHPHDKVRSISVSF